MRPDRTHETDPFDQILGELDPGLFATDAKHPSADLLSEETEAEFRNKERIIQQQDLLIREQDQSLRERHDEHELRKEFIHTIYTFVSTVVFAALLLTFFSAAGMIRISDAVLITILTTTIANVIGCLLIAFKWLFPSKDAH